MGPMIKTNILHDTRLYIETKVIAQDMKNKFDNGVIVYSLGHSYHDVKLKKSLDLYWSILNYNKIPRA